jgi:F-type H+-transporting ATPase subunit b
MKSGGRCGMSRLNWPVIAGSTAAIVSVLLVGVPAWAVSEGGHGGGHGGWQATDWYRVMNFAVLAIGLYLLLRKPAGQALSGRIKGIAQELEDLEARKAVAEKQLADYSHRLNALDKEASTIVAEYVRQGEEAKARILVAAESAADKLKEQAQKNIDHEFQRARLTLQQQVVEKALARAEKLIADKISAADQDRLIDEYLNKVVA